VSEWRRDLCISNTMAWSPDRKRFYTADTPINEMYVFDYDEATGSIANERPFLFAYDHGKPDGSTSGLRSTRSAVNDGGQRLGQVVRALRHRNSQPGEAAG